MRYYAVVEEVRKAEFTFTDEEMKDFDDEFVAANAFGTHELELVNQPVRYVDVYQIDEGVE